MFLHYQLVLKKTKASYCSVRYHLAFCQKTGILTSKIRVAKELSSCHLSRHKPRKTAQTQGVARGSRGGAKAEGSVPSNPGCWLLSAPLSFPHPACVRCSLMTWWGEKGEVSLRLCVRK